VAWYGRAEAGVEYRILGPLEISDGGRRVALKGSRIRALLVLLLTSSNHVVSTDRLIDELWGEDPPRAAANALQYHVSQLRKALAAPDVVVTQEPGYLIRVEPDQLDLFRFERLLAEGQDAPPADAARMLREALDLWRGRALADLEHEPFAQAEIRRLEELRLVALERRIEADLALGRRAELVGELETLTREHPYRESLRAQLMRALYGSGRQAEALDVYRETRRLLVDELGIEPGPAIQQLEQSILRQDPGLESPSSVLDGTSPRERRSITILVREVGSLDRLLAIAEPLAREPPRELILARLLETHDHVSEATAKLAKTRSALAERGVSARIAAYTASEPGAEAALLATQYDSDLLLLAGDPPDSRSLPDVLRVVLEQAPCDVAFLIGNLGVGSTGPIVTPFGGVDHDWSAIELAAWLARSLGTSLRLVGTEADDTRGRRDASRLLARASMLVQQLVGIVTEPALVPAGKDGVLEAADDARLLIIGLSNRWRTEGIGPARVAVAAGARVPTLFVRRGLRPGGLAPSETLTRFTWTLGPVDTTPT
jgi:DNA-binding SARP family transcriptional activator